MNARKPTENVGEIVAALMKAPRTRSELSEMAGASVQSVDRWLKALHSAGVIRLSGSRREMNGDGSTRRGRASKQWVMQATPFGAPDA